MVKDLDLPDASALGQFNRALRRILSAMKTIQENSIAKHLPSAVKEFTPISISLNEELESAAKVSNL